MRKNSICANRVCTHAYLLGGHRPVTDASSMVAACLTCTSCCSRKSGSSMPQQGLRLDIAGAGSPGRSYQGGGPQEYTDAHSSFTFGRLETACSHCGPPATFASNKRLPAAEILGTILARGNVAVPTSDLMCSSTCRAASPTALCKPRGIQAQALPTSSNFVCQMLKVTRCFAACSGSRIWQA